MKLLCFILALWITIDSYAQQTLKGSVERIKVHGKSLEGNLEGDSPNREVSIYLPPGYNQDKKKRYPVIYFLHGYTDGDAKWYGYQKHTGEPNGGPICLLVTFDQHTPNIRQLHGIAFDAGNSDVSIAASSKRLDSLLNNYQVSHAYEEYKGDHLNRIAERIVEKMLPFFSEQLMFKWA